MEYFHVPKVEEQPSVLMRVWRIVELKSKDEVFTCIAGSESSDESSLVRRSTQIVSIEESSDNAFYHAVTGSGRLYLLPKKGEAQSNRYFEELLNDFFEVSSIRNRQIKIITVKKWQKKYADKSLESITRVH